MFPGNWNIIFPDNCEKIIFQSEFFGKTIFSEHLQKISCFHVFFWERSSFIFCLKMIRWYFREKEISLVPIIQERSYSRAILFGKTIFSEHLQNKILFYVQWTSEILSLRSNIDKLDLLKKTTTLLKPPCKRAL